MKKIFLLVLGFLSTSVLMAGGGDQCYSMETETEGIKTVTQVAFHVEGNVVTGTVQVKSYKKDGTVNIEYSTYIKNGKLEGERLTFMATPSREDVTQNGHDGDVLRIWVVSAGKLTIPGEKADSPTKVLLPCHGKTK